MARIRLWKDRIVEKPRTYSTTSNPDGTITLSPVPGAITQQGTPVNAANMNGIEYDLQLMDNIVGTTQIPTINTSTNMVTQIQHKDSKAAILRTDTFDYSQANLIIETRTLASGSTITLKYHLDTLQVEVI